MAGTSLLALLDDIASILDDVALLTKVATKKTAGVLGDDLALNAQQVSGVRAEREIPVVWAVAKGSAVNKAILVPTALAISGLAPWAVTPLLMVGGAYLCFEGIEKVVHAFFHSDEEQAAEEVAQAERRVRLSDPDLDLVAIEKEKVKGAIRTDFVLSAEIVTIALGTVADADFWTRVAVLTGISLIMTAGVYGLVAGIVKLDDLGLWLHERGRTSAGRASGRVILKAAPYLMKALSIAGTIAMFLVGGGILMHGIPPAHHLIEQLTEQVHGIAGIGGLLSAVLPTLLNFTAGMLAGVVVLAVVSGVTRVFKKKTKD